jgi:hypothetical protein
MKLINIINWKKYFDGSHKRLSKYMDVYGDRIYPTILTSVKNALDSNLPHIPLFSYAEDPNMMCIVYKGDYLLLLKYMINWYSKREDYIKCMEIQKLIQLHETSPSVNKKSKSLTTKRK